MNGTVLSAVLTGVIGAPLLFVLQSLFGRKKLKAEALSIEVTNALAAVEPLKAVIETLTNRINYQESQMTRQAERTIAQTVKLDAAEERIGILERREREFLAFRADVIAYVQAVQARHGADIDPPTPPPALRPERTRRTDHEES